MKPLPTGCGVGELIDFLYDQCADTDVQTELLDFLHQAVHSDAELQMEHVPEKQMWVKADARVSHRLDSEGSDEGYQIIAGSGAVPQEFHDIDTGRQARFLPVRNGKIVGVANVQRLNS